MMSIAYIEQLSREQAVEARELGLVPHVIGGHADIDEFNTFPFPNLGSYRPKGWREVDRLFCDASGFGSESESALTQNGLRAKLHELFDAHPNYGYGIVECGQFQVYVGVFAPIKRRMKPSVPGKTFFTLKEEEQG